MKNLLKFSIFVHFFEKNGITAIFHALSREIVFISESELTSIRNSLSNASFIDIDNNKALNYLIKKGLVVMADNNEANSLG